MINKNLNKIGMVLDTIKKAEGVVDVNDLLPLYTWGQIAEFVKKGLIPDSYKDFFNEETVKEENPNAFTYTDIVVGDAGAPVGDVKHIGDVSIYVEAGTSSGEETYDVYDDSRGIHYVDASNPR